MILRDTVVEVDLRAIGANMDAICQMVGPDVAVMPVVKANAYGLGAVGVAPTLMEHGARYLAVATLSEAMELREAYADYPLFILGHTPDRLLGIVAENNITQTVFSKHQAKILGKAALALGKRAKVHLKVDTGFHRLGIDDVDELYAICNTDGIEVEGIFSHLALVNAEEDELRTQRLEETLKSFRIPAKVRHITHGPAISRFELEIAPGIKVNKVTNLNHNIAMNMAVKSVRMEAPIPGKALVGVEVPNSTRTTVTLKEVLQSDVMHKAKGPLTVALGKDIAGAPILCNLAKMPHLLIAGATGSGKSVCINTIINSLLYRCSPKEVRMILVDPKVVELQCYNGIPHLLIPVVSDPHKASGALAWAVGEMMDRYNKFQEKGVRAIDGYNEALDDDEEPMPRIVIVIDELADLMMTCKKEVEERICRLAQLARAAGIHLVVATQRPSVDVITGLIKANIPSRIAFKVSSNVDSRTILDRNGAEQLLGYGDMLYMPMGEFTPIRVQGCFLTDDEVNGITDFIRQYSPANYDSGVLDELDRLANMGNDGDEDDPDANSTVDEYSSADRDLFSQCVEMAVRDREVSTSLIQRRLKLGYARAGRLVDEMEQRGIISAKDGAKPRRCLISMEQYEAMKASGELK